MVFFVEGQKYYGKCAAQAQEDENGGRSGRHRKGGSERGEKGEARLKDEGTDGVAGWRQGEGEGEEEEGQRRTGRQWPG